MMTNKVLKCVLYAALLMSLLCGVYGDDAASNPCTSGKDSGNWCHGNGYVSCPLSTVRPCSPGLVCQQQNDPAGVVYCVRPTDIVPGSSSTTAPAPTTRPTSAPTAAPTSRPTSAPTTRPTQAPTARPTAAPTQKPSSTTKKGSHATTTTTSASTTAATTSASTTAAATTASTTTTATTASSTTAATTAAATTTSHAASTTSATVSTSTTGTIGGGGSGAPWPNGPVKAIYIDNNCWDPNFSFNNLVDAGYNLIILAFFVNGVSWDCTIAWGSMSQDQQLAQIAYAHSKGARIIASTGGSTDSPYSLVTGTAYGTSVARWVVSNNLDGMDFDLENFGRNFEFGALSTTQMVQWVADATNAARAILGTTRIITHAPQPPYFGANMGWADGYTLIYKLAPSINFFLVQFYNNGPTTTYQTMFINNPWGGSVSSMVASGIPLNKIVIGKPVHESDIGDTTQGYNTAAELKAIFAQAKSELGWNAGVMGWQWINAATEKAWINTIYPSA